MKITALVDRFGSNRLNADKPAELLLTCKPKITCVQVPFAGGMCEVAWFVDLLKANIVNLNDKDRHVMNLASVVRDRRAGLRARLEETPFHADVLAKAQEFCRIFDSDPVPDFCGDDGRSDGQTHCLPDPFDWAYHYYLCSWLTRGGKMGARGQFEQGLSVRWKSGGGDSVVRFRSATESLAEWQRIMQKCTFHAMDALEFLNECKAVIKGSPRDIPQNAIYADPPWVEDGKNYQHQIGHQDLRDMLESFQYSRVVVRYGDHPLVRELYREPRWTWHPLTSRTQANKGKAEVLLTNWRP